MSEMNYNIRVVMFDLGGVLLRTNDPRPRVELGRRFGLSREEIEKLVFGSEVSLKAEIGQAEPGEVWAHVQKKLRIAYHELAAIQDAFWAGDRLDEDLLAFVSTLRGRYRTVLLSNAWMDMRKNVARRFGSLDAFEMQIFSAEVGLRKPDPRIFQHVLDLLGADPEEIVFVDDFSENILAARKLGFRTIPFKNVQQTKNELEALLGLNSA